MNMLEFVADGNDTLYIRVNSQAVMGGVKVGEVQPATMESKKVAGLYFAGEVMDIDGPTGGYNLTLAFATARKAVEAIGQHNGKTDRKHR